MKFKLQKKKKAWDLFRKEIKIFIGFCISFTLGITIWFNWSEILKFIQLLNLKTMEFVAYFIALPFIIVFMLSYLTTAIKYLYRHLYIPLTHEELETNNIHTLEEYDEFIYNLFMGNCPLSRVHDEIEQTALENLQFGHKNNLHSLYETNFVMYYAINILIVAVLSILFEFGLNPLYQGIYSFICISAFLLLLTHLGSTTYDRCFYCEPYCSFFKIARIQKKKH